MASRPMMEAITVVSVYSPRVFQPTLEARPRDIMSTTEMSTLTKTNGRTMALRALMNISPWWSNGLKRVSLRKHAIQHMVLVGSYYQSDPLQGDLFGVFVIGLPEREANTKANSTGGLPTKGRRMRQCTWRQQQRVILFLLTNATTEDRVPPKDATACLGPLHLFVCVGSHDGTGRRTIFSPQIEIMRTNKKIFALRVLDRVPKPLQDLLPGHNRKVEVNLRLKFSSAM